MKSNSRSKQRAQSGRNRQSRMCRFGYRVTATIMVAISGAFPGCTKTDSGQDLQAKAQRVTENVGKVVKTSPARKFGPVFVFEEYHTSRVGQIQIATMLTRLYQQQGLRVVGLEGAVKGPAPLPAQKYLNTVEGATRNAVLKDLLCEAEISGAEYVGALLPGLQVVGIENADEYNVRPVDDEVPEFMAVMAIAERTLKPEQLQEIVAHLSRNKVQEALDVMKAADPWIKERLDALKNPSLTLADEIGNITAIKAKAESLHITLPAEVVRGLESRINFYRTAEKRSVTMADAVAGLAKQTPGKAVAIIIGAAHTERIMAELAKKDVTAVVLQARAFKGDDDKADIRRFVLKSKGFWGNDAPDSLGAILNPQESPSDRKRKPAPVIGDLKRDGYASAQAAVKIAAKAVRDGGDFPKAIIDQIQALPGITLDANSFEKRGFDVIFAFDIEDTSGKKQKVWVRAGTMPVETKSSDDPVAIAVSELEKAEEEAGVKRKTDAGKGGENERPKDKKTTETDKPGERNTEGKRENEAKTRSEEMIGSLTNREVKAKFFRSAEEAKACPPISR